ncbi:Thromboxane-A synthase [Labeo rohita]|uniref:Thromboxane-A synthase n=1 Tax=Labeo rohita TaxID=84645 RepID=A0ABQ8L5A6_LABRO|nr:Thromboxane-A synthase [Labeo rohita]
MPKKSQKEKHSDKRLQTVCSSLLVFYSERGYTQFVRGLLGSGSRRALFKEGAFTTVPRGSSPASAEAERWLHSWGSQLDLLEGMETGEPLSPSSPGRSRARSQGSEAHSVATSSQGTASMLRISSSEEVESELPPSHRSLPFFPDLHTEVSRSWGKPFSARLFVPVSDYYGNVAGTTEFGYRAIPRVEQTLASYLSPEAALSLKAPVLPSKLLRTTSALVGKGYWAAGQAGACLHTMAVLQAYQADLLKELDESDEISQYDISELRRAADLSLRATKETARAIGQSMAAMVAAERHLWLTLSDMKEKDRVFLLDAPLVPSGLFQEARKQAAAFQRFLPHCFLTLGAAGQEQPQPSTSSSYRARRSPRRKAAPAGEGQGAPHSTVSVSPQCPQETIMCTLPVFQDAVVSGEPIPQSLPPGNVIPFGLLYMRPLQWWLRTKGLSLRGNPFRMIKITRRCLRALDMWKKPWFLSQGPVLGTPYRRVTLATDASHRLGYGHEWPLRPGSVERSPSHLAHQLPGDAGRVLSVETLSPGPNRPPCVGSHRQHSGGLLHQPPGRSVFTPLGQAGAPDPCVVPGQTPLTESSSCSWASQYGSRHPVEAGAEARGMEASPRGGEAYYESFWPGSGGPLRDSGECAMSPLVLSDSSSSTGAGCHGTDVVEASSVRLSPDSSAPRSSGEGALGRGPSFFGSPVLAGPSMVLGPDFPPRRLSMGDSRQEGSPLASGRHHPSLLSGVVEVMGVASEGAHLVASGLSTEVVETILQSRAPSTRKLYALKWKLFTSWCGHRQQDPVNCPAGTVLEYLQDRFSAGLAHSTLLALTSLKRVGDLQALSVAPSHLEFAPGMAKAFLYPRPGYVPKVPSSAPRPVVLQAFCPPPFRDPDQQKLNPLGSKNVPARHREAQVANRPHQLKQSRRLHFIVYLGCLHLVTGRRRAVRIRALDTYVHRAALWRNSDQLFVCYGPPKSGLPASKHTLSRWIVDAISLAYEFSGLPSPLGVKAHSTRGISASKAFMSGVPMRDICDAAGWSTPLTFIRFYDLDLRVTPGSSTQLEFLKGNVSGYDCNPGSPKGTRRCVSCHTSCIPASVRFFLKLNAGSSAQRVYAESVPQSVCRRIVSFPSGNRGYSRNLRRSQRERDAALTRCGNSFSKTTV